KAIAQFREKRLAEDFKRKAVSAAVKIDENEINDYYAKNTAKYMMQDLFNLGLITVPSMAEADSVISELKKGGSFAHLAEKKSGDSSSVKGGDIGWVSAERFSDNILSAFRIAKEGEVLGPFDASEGKGYTLAIFEFRGMKKGEPIPFEQIKQSVKMELGREKYSELLVTYLKRLRENIPIEINEDEMAKF
ncbi:MAG: peptidyl-prolyl cis-trans isomerase, partial [Deltaproteobacteria bacterium]